MNYRPLVFVALALLASCSAHSPMIIKNTVDSAPATSTQYPAHTDKVFVTQDPLAPSDYEVISQIDVGRIWYGESSSVLGSMANRARQLGADAVIEVKTWHQPSGFSWSAPHGSGKAIAFKAEETIDFSKLRGQWL